MRRFLKLFTTVTLILLISCQCVLAHSGRTDANGGHYNRKTGEYHYHNNGGYQGSSGGSSYSSTPKIRVYNAPTKMKVGDSIKLSASYAISDCIVTSSAPSIIRVNDDNTLTAISEGTARITIYKGSSEESFSVTVQKNYPTDISIGADFSLEVGTTKQLEVSFTPVNASARDILWESSNINVATVDDGGFVTAKSDGTATIIAIAEGGVTATIKVEVFQIYPESITILDPPNTISADEDIYLKPLIKPDNTTNKNITWSSSDENIATIGDNNRVFVKNSGTVSLTATTINGKSCTINIKTVYIKPDNIVINKDSVGALRIGNVLFKLTNSEFSPTAEIHPANASFKDYTLSLSNKNVSKTISGEVTLRKHGIYTLKAETREGIHQEITIVAIPITAVIVIVLIIIALILVLVFYRRTRRI